VLSRLNLWHLVSPGVRQIDLHLCGTETVGFFFGSFLFPFGVMPARLVCFGRTSLRPFSYWLLLCLLFLLFALYWNVCWTYRAEKQAALQEADEASEDSDGDGDASECPDDSTMPINGEEVEGDGGYSRYNWSLDVEYTQEEKIAMFDDYMASRWGLLAAAGVEICVAMCHNPRVAL